MKKLNKVILSGVVVSTLLMGFSVGFAQTKEVGFISAQGLAVLPFVKISAQKRDLKEIFPNEEVMEEIMNDQTKLNPALRQKGYLLIDDAEILSEVQLVGQALGHQDKISVGLWEFAGRFLPLAKHVDIFSHWGLKANPSHTNTYRAVVNAKAVQEVIDLYRNQVTPKFFNKFGITIINLTETYSLDDLVSPDIRKRVFAQNKSLVLEIVVKDA